MQEWLCPREEVRASEILYFRATTPLGNPESSLRSLSADVHLTIQQHQKALQAKWDSGDRSGLKVRPATDSLHSRIAGTGSPASLAIDITTKDSQMAGQIAHALDIGWGGDFAGQSNYDPVHFYDKKGTNGL